MTFLPENYKTPDNSDYMKFKDGENTFRVLSSAIVGFEYFNKDNKPVRSREPFKETPGIKDDGKVKHFWAFVIWNYEAEKIQLLEVPQATIQGSIMALVKNKNWGDPKEYDITINKTGEKLLTEYSITPNPKLPVSSKILEAYKNRPVNLEALYTGEDPFNSQAEQAKEIFNI